MNKPYILKDSIRAWGSLLWDRLGLEERRVSWPEEVCPCFRGGSRRRENAKLYLSHNLSSPGADFTLC